MFFAQSQSFRPAFCDRFRVLCSGKSCSFSSARQKRKKEGQRNIQKKTHLVVVSFPRHLRGPAGVRRGLMPPAEGEVATGSPEEELRADEVELLVQNGVVRRRRSLELGIVFVVGCGGGVGCASGS